MTATNELQISYYSDTDTLELTAAPPPWAMGETIARDLMVSLDKGGRVQSATIEHAAWWLLPLLYGVPHDGTGGGRYALLDAPHQVSTTDHDLALEYDPHDDCLLLFGGKVRTDAGAPVEVANGLTAFVTNDSVLGLRIKGLSGRLRPYLMQPEDK